MLAVDAPSSAEWFQIAGLGFFLLMGGYLGASEIALSRLSVARAQVLHEVGRRGAKRVLQVVSEPGPYLNSILLLTQVAAAAAAILAATAMQSIFGNAGLSIATAGVTILGFVFAEVIPKTYTLQHTERVALICLPPISVVSVVVSPISRVLIAFSNVILPGKGLPEGPFVSEAELKQLVSIAGQEEVIEAEEQRMIHSVFEFTDTVAREVMVPRPDMVVVDVEAPMSEALKLVVDHGFSRIPAYRGDIDHIEGILYAKDILARIHNNGKASAPIADLLRPAEFVPEAKRISELLREMQQRKFHMAIVFDEHGDVSGLVTLEDLIEEIVGEIVDEYDTGEPELEKVDEATLRVHGRLSIDDASDALGAPLPEGEWDTVGGLVVSLLGRVPRVHETVESGAFRFTAERVEGHRILRVLIHRVGEEQAAEVV